MARAEDRLITPGRVAAALGAAAAANGLLARRAERQTPPIGRILKVDGADLHVVERGEGPPLVLIHGNGSLVQDFLVSGLVDRLAARHRVILFDRPGYGHSSRQPDREWTAEAQGALFAEGARQLGLVNPIVVGHSFGVLPAIAWALDRPGEVAALGLMSGYYYPTARPDAQLQKLADLPLVRPLLAHTLMPLQGRITGPLGNRMIFSPARPTQAYRRHMPFGLMLRPGQLQAVVDDGAHMPGAARRLSARYHQLHLPLLIAWGAGDKMVRQKKQSGRLAAELPHAATLRLEEVGHMLHHTAPAQVASALEALAEEAAPLQRQLEPLPPRPISDSIAAAPLRGIR